MKGSSSFYYRSLLVVVGVYSFVTSLGFEGPMYTSPWTEAKGRRLVVVLVVDLVWGRKEARGVCIIEGSFVGEVWKR